MLNTLLKKRGGSTKKGLMLGNCHNDFESTYWRKHNVEQQSVSIRDLDKYLKRAQAAL